MKKILLVLLIFLIISTQLNAQWHWQNPTPIGKPIYDMQFLDSLNGYVCGYGGMILKTTDGGSRWTELEIPSDGLIIKIFFLNNNVGWYLSYDDMILYKTTDAGKHWNFVSSFSPRYAETLWFVDELKGFAGGYYNLLKTTDGGLTWIEDTTINSAYSIFFLNSTTGFVGSYNRINKTTDGGNTWTYKGIPSFSLNPSRIFIYDTNNFYVVGTGQDTNGDPINLFYQTSNGGTSWSVKTFEHTVTDVFFESPSKGFVCAGNILSTTDRGVSWDTTRFAALRFEFIGSNSWSANYNTIDYSIDGWLSATPQINGIFSGFLWDGCAKDTNTAFACGSYKTIVGTTDGGKNWNKYYSSSDNLYLNGITIIDDEIWAVGQQGVVVYSKDNGNTWIEKNIAGNWLSDITFLNNGVGYIVGTYGGGGAILTSLDGGENWNLVEIFPNIVGIDKIKFSRNDLGWAIGYPQSILRSTTNGKTWEVVIDSVYGLSNIAVCGDTAWFTYMNRILKTTDAGNTWESFKVFDYNSMIFSNSDVDFANPMVGYLSTYDGRVFKTIDGGETWLQENYPTGIDNFAMDFVNEEVGWVFGYPGIILKRDPNLVSVEDPGYENHYLDNYMLSQNFPNPFNSQTTISYSVPISSLVQIQIFDVLGREVSTLLNEEKAAGNYRINFNASELTSGVYFYRLQAGDPSTGSGQSFVQTKKMILLK